MKVELEKGFGAQDWWSGHLYADAERLDGLVLALAPIAGRVSRWFFIRYADGGFHIRFRIQGSCEQLGAALPAVVEAARAGGATAVIGAAYEPEWQRYGRAARMHASEVVFWRSSELVVALLRAQALDRRGSALGWGGLFASAAYRVAERNGLVTRGRSGVYARHLGRLLACEGRSGVVERARRVAAGWRRLGAALADQPGFALGADPRLTAAAHAYLDALAAYAALVGHDEAAGLAIDSQLHMTFNRLGLSNLEELDVMTTLAATEELAERSVD